MLATVPLRSATCLSLCRRSLNTSSTQSSWFFSKTQQIEERSPSIIFQLTETVVPSQWDAYVKHKELNIQSLLAVQDVRCNHVASWSVVTGDTLFKAVHLFKYDDAFSFWPSADKREGNNVYDIRQDVPYTGLFTQLGKLHTIYHIWCYKSLADRKQCREGTWAHPEWNDIVANTVPLVKTMETKIVEPLPFSPTQ